MEGATTDDVISRDHSINRNTPVIDQKILSLPVFQPPLLSVAGTGIVCLVSLRRLPFSYGLHLSPSFSIIALTVVDLYTFVRQRDPCSYGGCFPSGSATEIQTEIGLEITNRYPFRINLRVIDELPDQLQERHFLIKEKMRAGESKTVYYRIRPTRRGEYIFHAINAYVKGPFRFVIRRRIMGDKQVARVYPSFLFLRQFEFQAHFSNQGGANLKKVRRSGSSMEFEQIRDYVNGDDIRSINWRATAKNAGQLMINSYTDEKSQQIYCVIDKGRVMKMPFNGLTLLDYAINAALMMTGVALAKQDKTGLISFGDKAGDFLPASHQSFQMNSILNSLYNLQTKFAETDYAPLHGLIKTRINQRSLLVLFTNFESLDSLKRQLPYLRSLSTKHLLLVVFFENTPLAEMADQSPVNMESLYEKVIAEKFILEKKLIVKELQRYGIIALLTAPDKLTVNVVNKYLEIKERREI